MWTSADRALVGEFGSGQALTDDQFRLLEPLLPLARPGGRPRSTGMRIAGRPVLPPAYRLSVAASAATSRLRDFLETDVWESIRHHFVVMLREGAGRDASPSAAVIDTQSVKTTESGGPRGLGCRQAAEGAQTARRGRHRRVAARRSRARRQYPGC